MPGRRSDWSEEGTNLLRGVGGGAIIAMPLVYTMEVWFIGMYVSSWHIVGFLAFAFLLNTGLSSAAGFRPEHDLSADMRQSITALGMGAVLSLIFLLLLRVIHSGIAFSVAVDMVAVLSVPVSIGVCVANTQFGEHGRVGGRRRGEMPAGHRGEDIEIRRIRADLLDIGIALAGATIFVLGLVTIEEIDLIANRTTGLYWALLVIFSIVLTYGMVFVADFAGRDRRHEPEGLLQQPLTETILSYSLAVFVGLFLLYILGRPGVFASVSSVVAYSAVIGLPASVGAAAGRLIV